MGSSPAGRDAKLVLHACPLRSEELALDDVVAQARNSRLATELAGAEFASTVLPEFTASGFGPDDSAPIGLDADEFAAREFATSEFTATETAATELADFTATVRD